MGEGTLGQEPRCRTLWLVASGLCRGRFAHDDYTLLATGPLEPGQRSQLSRIATRELGGLVPRYRLTASSVLSALQDGLNPEEIPGLLSEVCLNTVSARACSPSSTTSLAERMN